MAVPIKKTVVNDETRTLPLFITPLFSLSVSDIAKQARGTLVGDGAVVVTGIAPLESAQASDLSFFAPSSRRKRIEMLSAAKQTKAGAVLVREEVAEITAPQIIVSNPMEVIIHLATQFQNKPKWDIGIHPQAVVDPSADIADNASIGAFAFIGKNVQIGAGSVICPNVVVYEGARIGEDCIVHSGAVIREFVCIGNRCVIQNGVIVGGDGFGYIPDAQLGHRHIPHIGSVALEDGVDIGPNTTIDRGMLGQTVIGENSKIDNLVMIGHNTVIGKASILCGQVGVSGSCRIGSNVTLGGRVGVADHLSIGDNVRAAAASGIAQDVEPGRDVGGTPARSAKDWLREDALTRRLPELFRQVAELRKKIGLS